MPPLVDPASKVCLGIEFAWWGGFGRGNPESCADNIVGHDTVLGRVLHRSIDLRSAPNPAAADSSEPNYDADANLITLGLKKELGRFEDLGVTQFIVAINTPITTIQRIQGSRKRILRKGDTGGTVRRSCEVRFLEKVKAVGGIWSQGVSVQPGAPIAPRISRFVERLSSELGFEKWSPTTDRQKAPSRLVIETLPLEALWALGVAGAYGELLPDRVGRYRKCERCVVSQSDAKIWVKWAISGYAPLIGDVLDMPAIAESVAHLATDVRATNGTIRLTKRYTGVVDAAITWLTACAFQYGRFHEFYDADFDGCIVGPGKIPSGDKK
jgi:hypothetical protein